MPPLTALLPLRATPIDRVAQRKFQEDFNKNVRRKSAVRGEHAMTALVAVGFLALTWILVLWGSTYFNKNVV
jgi:hypothetical protein